MKTLFGTSSALELGAGLAVLLSPEVFVDLLLRSTLDEIAALTVARISGAALTALAVACWLARKDPGSAAARGLTQAIPLWASQSCCRQLRCCHSCFTSFLALALCTLWLSRG